MDQTKLTIIRAVRDMARVDGRLHRQERKILRLIAEAEQLSADEKELLQRTSEPLEIGEIKELLPERADRLRLMELSVLVGINDVWRLTAEPSFAAQAAPPDLFEVTYDRLLSQTKETCDAQLVLMEPFLFCADRRNELYEALLPYVEIVGKLAANHHGVVVPLQQEIDRSIAEVPPERWSDDMVHPHVWAHAWIAQRWLEATGF